MTRVLCIGECMVELAPAEGELFAMGFAGDTFNTAWYLRRLLPASVQVDYLSAVGEDAISTRMLAFMSGEGLGTGHIARIPGRSVGLYMIQLQDGERSFSYWRSTSAARCLAADAGRLARALDGVSLAYVSGITLAILPPEDRDHLLKALAAARATGTVVAFDPNIRPALWSDPGTMRASLMAGAEVADIVLPSFDDEAKHFGDVDPAATARRYSAAGMVIVKDGANPITALVGGALSLHPTEAPVAIVDTTAAGDSFNAGFLAAHLSGSGLADAVAGGARLAARVVAEKGALARVAVIAP